MGWKTLRTDTIFENQWLRLERNEVITPSGNPGVYTIVSTPPFVVIVAMNGTKILMVRQHRFTVNKETLEFPAGGIEEGEKSLEAAKRELREETNHVARKWELLATLDDAVGIAKHEARVFLAEDLAETASKLTDDAVDAYEWVDIATLQRLIREKITDTKTIAICYMIMTHEHKKEETHGGVPS